jgi:hypothetical protein
MATPELTQRQGRAAGRWAAAVSLNLWLRSYAAVWVLTLLAAGVVKLAGLPLAGQVRGLLGLTLSPHANPVPSLVQVLRSSAHNLPLVAWPLLLGALDAHRHDRRRRAADALVAGWLAVNVLPVGAALGAYGTALLPYIPQVPLEWAGLALATSAWVAHRYQPNSPREALALLALMLMVLLSAGALEAYAVPHR